MPNTETMTTVKITKVVAAGKPYKTRDGYSFPVSYELEDGRRLSGSEGRRLLREAKAAAAALPRYPRNMAAIFDTDGSFFATEERFGFGV